MSTEATNRFIGVIDTSSFMGKKPATHAPLDKIQADPNQPRKAFDEGELQELSDSIKANGVLSPIGVLAAVDGIYTIAFGERRWRASKLAGLADIPITIVDPAKVNIRAAQLVENIQRSRLTADEIASAIDDLAKGGMKGAEIAAQLGLSKARVSEYRAVMEMPEAIRAHLNRIGAQSAYQLFGLWKKDQNTVEAFLCSTPPEAIQRGAIARLADVVAGKSEGTSTEPTAAALRNESGSTTPVPLSPPDGGSTVAPLGMPQRHQGSRQRISAQNGDGHAPTPSVRDPSSPSGHSEPVQPQFIVKLGEEFGRLLIDRAGPDSKTALVAFDQGRDIRPVALSDLVIFEIVSA